jgi:hypothetical protein
MCFCLRLLLPACDVCNILSNHTQSGLTQFIHPGSVQSIRSHQISLLAFFMCAILANTKIFQARCIISSCSSYCPSIHPFSTIGYKWFVGLSYHPSMCIMIILYTLCGRPSVPHLFFTFHICTLYYQGCLFVSRLLVYMLDTFVE